LIPLIVAVASFGLVLLVALRMTSDDVVL